MLFSLSPCLEFLPELKLSSLSRESASDESFSEELFKMQPKTVVNELLALQCCVHCLLFSQFFKHLSWADFGLGQGHCGHSFFCDFLSVSPTPFGIFWIRPCHLQLMNILTFISHLFTLVKDSKLLTGLVITKRINHRVVFTNEIVLYNFQQTLRKFTHYSPALPRTTIFPDLEKNCLLAFP